MGVFGFFAGSFLALAAGFGAALGLGVFFGASLAFGLAEGAFLGEGFLLSGFFLEGVGFLAAGLRVVETVVFFVVVLLGDLGLLGFFTVSGFLVDPSLNEPPRPTPFTFSSVPSARSRLRQSFV